MNQYTCQQCGETDNKVRPNEDCWKEMNQIMPEAINDDIAVVCDDCFRDFMEWFKTLTPAQKRKMREDYIKEETH